MVSASIPQTLHLNITYEEIPTNVSTTACSSCNYANATCNFPTTCHSPCILECFMQLQHFKRVRTQEHRAIRQWFLLRFPSWPFASKAGSAIASCWFIGGTLCWVLWQLHTSLLKSCTVFTQNWYQLSRVWKEMGKSSLGVAFNSLKKNHINSEWRSGRIYLSPTPIQGLLRWNR